MGFLSQLRQDLQQSLADQQRLALVQVLRKRFSTLTFDDLRQILTSPLGKGLGPMRLAEVLVAPESATATPAEKPKAPSKAPARKKKSPARKAAKKRQKSDRPRRTRPAKATGDQATTPATPPTSGRKARRKAKSAAKARSGAQQPAEHGPDWRPPGMSSEQAAEMARYGEAVLALIRKAGDWIAANEIRDQVGKSPEQLRLALRKLEASGDIVRTGQRGHTRYRTAAAR